MTTAVFFAPLRLRSRPWRPRGLRLAGVVLGAAGLLGSFVAGPAPQFADRRSPDKSPAPSVAAVEAPSTGVLPGSPSRPNGRVAVRVLQSAPAVVCAAAHFGIADRQWAAPLDHRPVATLAAPHGQAAAGTRAPPRITG